MPLNSEQKTVLAANILVLQASGQPLFGVTDEQAIANHYNAAASPDYYVKRSLLSRHEILTGTSDDGTTFAWAGSAYITRSQGERDAFREMFNSTGAVNPWLPSILSAFADIFSGAGGAGNRAHITAMSRRVANRLERLFATGAGTKPSPSDLSYEGAVTAQEVSNAIRGV